MTLPVWPRSPSGLMCRCASRVRAWAVYIAVLAPVGEQAADIVSTDMRKAILATEQTVSLPGLKPQWKTSCKNGDVVVVGDVTFVRVAASVWSLNQLVAADNDAVPDDDGDGHGLLSRSIGLKELTNMRNQRQAADTKEAAQPKCSLFSKSEPTSKKAHRISRGEIASMRDAPKYITLSVEVDDVTHDVDVLRAVHPSDNLFVAFNDDMIATVLHVLRSKGFTSTQRDYNKDDRPKGILKRKGCFVVKFEKSDGSSGYKKQRTLEDAFAFLANPTVKRESAEPAADATDSSRSSDWIATDALQHFEPDSPEPAAERPDADVDGPDPGASDDDAE